ncbi:MAG: sugar ABC transporter permease [Lachnospiraceae bacterium]|nr:sugar ABC transporter permease [Lachnospiraceae bacterium]
MQKRKTVEYGKYGYFFILPFFIIFLIFQFYPLISTFWTSFDVIEKTGRNNETLVRGFGNFSKFVFTKDSEIWKSLGVTVLLWLSNFAPQILFSLLLAAWFTNQHAKLKGQGAYKVIMYMPNIITAATIAVLFFNLFAQTGPLGQIFTKINLNKGWWSFAIIAFIQFWMWYGNTMIVLIAGIMGISPSLYEAAMVDGANGWQQFRMITIPLLKPILQFTMVTSAIGGLQMYDIPQLFNKGDPQIVTASGASFFSTKTVVMVIKQYIIGTSANLGRASAYSVMLFFVTLVVSMIFYKATSEKKSK